MILKIKKDYSEFFKRFGIDDTVLEKEYIDYQNITGVSDVKNFIWHLFNKTLIESSKNYTSLKELYFIQYIIYGTMLNFRRKYEKAKANEILRLFLKASILHSYSESNNNLKLEVVIISGHCCEYCDSLKDERYGMEDVLNNEYLGSDKCTNTKGCNCCYSLVPKRDEHGRFIRLKN